MTMGMRVFVVVSGGVAIWLRGRMVPAGAVRKVVPTSRRPRVLDVALGLRN